MKKRNWIIPLILVILVLIIGGFFIISKMNNNSPNGKSANELLQIYQNDFYGPQITDTNSIDYFNQLINLGWNESSFTQVMNNSFAFAMDKMQILNSNRTQPVLLNIGVGKALSPENARTLLYRQNGQYGIIIGLHLEIYPKPVYTSSVDFWENNDAWIVNHEMRHVKRLFESGLFDKDEAEKNLGVDDTGSNILYSEYINGLMNKYNIPSEFNTTSTAQEIDELTVVLETDSPHEVALNLDRILNSLTLAQLKYDESLGVNQVAPPYLEEITLANHLSQAYAKPSIQRQSHSMNSSIFDKLSSRSADLKAELYRAYPNDTKQMQDLEKIYEQEADKAILENKN